MSVESNMVHGRFAAYRVFSVSPRFSDRGQDSRAFTAPLANDGSSLDAILGSVPPSLVTTLNRRVLVDVSPMHHLNHQDIKELDHALLAEPEEAPEFVEEGATYLTLTATVPAEFEAIPGRRIFWVKDCDALGQELLSFADDARTVLDRAASRLLAAGINASEVSFEGSKAVHFEPSSSVFAAIYAATIRGTATVDRLARVGPISTRRDSKGSWPAFVARTSAAWSLEPPGGTS